MNRIKECSSILHKSDVSYIFPTKLSTLSLACVPLVGHLLGLVSDVVYISCLVDVVVDVSIELA